MSVLNMRKEIQYGNEPVGKVSQNNPSSECDINGAQVHGLSR